MQRRTENLIPIKNTDDAKRLGKNGGIKSGESRRNKKTFKDLVNILLEKKVENDKIKKLVLTLFPDLDESEITNKVAIFAAALKEAIKGNIKAFEVLRDTAGEKPTDKIDHTSGGETIVSISPAMFVDTINKDKEEDVDSVEGE